MQNTHNSYMDRNTLNLNKLCKNKVNVTSAVAIDNKCMQHDDWQAVASLDASVVIRSLGSDLEVSLHARQLVHSFL